jgi:hypothetical protein
MARKTSRNTKRKAKSPQPKRVKRSLLARLKFW